MCASVLGFHVGLRIQRWVHVVDHKAESPRPSKPSLQLFVAVLTVFINTIEILTAQVVVRTEWGSALSLV